MRSLADSLRPLGRSLRPFAKAPVHHAVSVAAILALAALAAFQRIDGETAVLAILLVCNAIALRRR